jgi:hypothetical protein
MFPVHRAFTLHPHCVPKKVDINQKGIQKKDSPIRKNGTGVGVTERSQATSVKTQNQRHDYEMV